MFNEKVGHTETLDPNTTGLLLILIGQGTKLSYYLINHDKEYEVTLQLGIKTDTADGEGKVLEEQNVNKEVLEEENVANILKSFIGKQLQTPPIYSAIKLNGKKLYEYARKNIQVDVKPREIEVYYISITHINAEKNELQFTVKCSKGTYIRSLCEDIAKKMGTIGYMKELNRTKVGIFDIRNSIKIEELEDNKDNETYLKEHIISIEDLFIELYGDENKVMLSERKIELFLNGVKLTQALADGLYRIYDEKGTFIGIGSVKDRSLKREIVVA